MNELQEEIWDYLVEREWHRLNPGDLAKSISIEAAELLEHFQWSQPSAGELKADPEKMVKIRKEIADVIIYALELCSVFEIDFQEVVKEKLAHVRKKYPVEEVLGKRDNYHAIKEKYRREGIN
jgi:NTP pyrophosphatase (non-canonical NTP hydrolase)